MAINFSKTEGPHQGSGALSGGGQHASGAGRSHGNTGGDAGGGSPAGRPRFDVAVPHDGYRWWYIDAISDDGQNGLTIIGFVGSVFSPYYASARKRGLAEPENHCAINVALYGTKRRWAMTERTKRHVSRNANSFVVGPSSMRWEDDELVIAISETCVPWPFALRGSVRLKANHIYDAPVSLNNAGQHFWQAVAPQARVVVDFENPNSSWEGNAYHDMNWGDEPIERGFKNWTWARATTNRGVEVLYDLERHDGSAHRFGLCFQKGEVSARNVPAVHGLARGFWGMKRTAPSETAPRLIATLEDAPFYTRNHVALTLDGVACEAIHESLSLDRFVHPLVQLMLPFRMPRVR